MVPPLPRRLPSAPAGQPVVTRLCAALAKDCGGRNLREDGRRDDGTTGRRDDGTVLADLSDLLNVALVLLGVRSGARLDQSSYAREGSSDARCAPWGRSHLSQAVGREAARLGARVAVLDAYEPLLLDLDAVSERDVRTLRERYARSGASHSSVSDLREPVVGAMGRALGYACPYPRKYPRGAAAAAGTVIGLEARVRRVDGGAPNAVTESLWLAGFACGSGAAGARARTAAADRWLVPACAALGGCTLRYAGRRYVVTGFDLVQ